MTVYVFDMDGTLTPARLPMTESCAERFYCWQKTHLSFIATGSDYAKVKEQLPEKVINAFTGIYCSMGNVLKAQGKDIYKKDAPPLPALIQELEKYRNRTKYPGRQFPNYIERRIGMINFSVLGRDCPYSEREKYADWDKEHAERLKIKSELQEKFPGLEISVGGSISIDIVPAGGGKGQIAMHLRQRYPFEKILFFGDRTFEGGNDFELARALLKFENTQVVQVNGPEDVLHFLKENP